MKLKMKKILALMLTLTMLFALTACGNNKKQANAAATNETATSFPGFVGKDLAGNDVDSSTLFSSNQVTVVNFWFSGCSACVEEMDELNTLNERLKEQGGMLIGINTDTLDGNKDQIAMAKSILEQKGAVYQNIWFDRNSDAGAFSNRILGFPTTYVVDSNGHIVGAPLVGAITDPAMMDQLMAQVNQALGEDDAGN